MILLSVKEDELRGGLNNEQFIFFYREFILKEKKKYINKFWTAKN